MSEAPGILVKPYNEDPRKYQSQPAPDPTVEVPVRVITLLRDALHILETAKDRKKALEEFEKFRSLDSRQATEDEVRASDQPKYIAKYDRLTDKERAEIRRKLYVAPGNCDHLKGGVRKSFRRDYNFSYHRFIDHSEEIKCLTCKTKWHPGDIGWDFALTAFNTMSTNTKTSSEAMMYAAQFKSRDTEFYKTVADILRRYPCWDGEISPPGTTL